MIYTETVISVILSLFSCFSTYNFFIRLCCINSYKVTNYGSIFYLYFLLKSYMEMMIIFWLKGRVAMMCICVKQ